MARLKPPGFFMVVPCYNVEQGLSDLHRWVSALCRGTMGDAYKIVLVKDSPWDNIWANMGILAQSDRHLAAVNLTGNYRYLRVLYAGLSRRRGERILMIDAGLYDLPELLLGMMARIGQDCDAVRAQREEREWDWPAGEFQAAGHGGQVHAQTRP